MHKGTKQQELLYIFNNKNGQKRRPKSTVNALVLCMRERKWYEQCRDTKLEDKKTDLSYRIFVYFNWYNFAMWQFVSLSLIWSEMQTRFHTPWPIANARGIFSRHDGTPLYNTIQSHRCRKMWKQHLWKTAQHRNFKFVGGSDSKCCLMWHYISSFVDSMKATSYF